MPLHHWTRLLIGLMAVPAFALASDAVYDRADGLRWCLDHAVAAESPGLTDSLCTKACALLGAWTSAPPRPVTLGRALDGAGHGAGVVMDPGLVVLTAALEITVHGWDVARALDLDHPLPPALAVDLLPVARALVGEGRFAPALAVAGDPGAPSGVRLLGAVGRKADRPLRRTR